MESGKVLFWNQCSNVAVESHTMRLIVGDTSTTITVVIESYNVALENAFVVRFDKLLIPIIGFPGRHKRQTTISQGGHIVLVTLDAIKEICQIKSSPTMTIHQYPPFCSRRGILVRG